MNVSNEQPPVRNVIPYKSGKRPSTFRRLNIDFAGTAIEEALKQQERQREQGEAITSSPSAQASIETTIHHSPPVTTTPQLEETSGTTSTHLVCVIDENKTDAVPLEFPGADRTEESPPVTTTPQQNLQNNKISVAPARDFNRRANSLDRDAMPSGLFPGSTKKVYDALYIRTRGAIVPAKSIRASRRDLLTWTGIRNLKTIDNHIRYLMAMGLIVRHWELGSNEGSSYEVRLPEEIASHHSPPLTTSGGEWSPLTTTQKTGSGYTQKLGSGGEGQIIDNSDTYTIHKTIKTIDDDDTHTLEEFLQEIIEAARVVVGGELVTTEQERERWKELGHLLADELKNAAKRAGNISSVPAFFTAHLRRKLTKSAPPSAQKVKTDEQRPHHNKVTTGKEPAQNITGKDKTADISTTNVRSRFSLMECLSYAEHLYKTGQGINNPGGFATAIYRSGMADPLIARFLNPIEETQPMDIRSCPDCRGTGFYYPQGPTQGVIKCKHEQLTERNDLNVDEPPQGQRLTAAEINEQASIIAELIESGYTLKQAESQFASSLHPEDWQKIIELLSPK